MKTIIPNLPRRLRPLRLLRCSLLCLPLTPATLSLQLSLRDRPVLFVEGHTTERPAPRQAPPGPLAVCGLKSAHLVEFTEEISAH